MSDRVAILTAGDDEVFIDLLEHFPPERYTLLYGDGLARVRPLYDAHPPRLLVVRLDGTGWQLTPILREAQGKQIPILGLSSEDDPSWRPSKRDRLLPPRPTAPVIEAAKDLLGERRRFARTPLNLPLDLGGGNEAVATISSAGSLFVPTEQPLAVGDKLELGIAYEGTELRCVSPVVRVEMDADNRGMVLVVPEGRARNLLDAIVRRMLLSEHYRQLAERSVLDEAVGSKIAARARRILLEVVAGAADDEEEEPARLVLRQSTQPPRTFDLPVDFSIPDDELEAAWAGNIELGSEITDAMEAEARTSSPDVAASSPDVAASAPDVAASAPDVAEAADAAPAPEPAAAAPTPEPEPPRPPAHTPTHLPAFEELSPTEAGVFPARKPMRTPSAVSAVSLDSENALHALEARLAGLEGHVERIAETRPSREELQQQTTAQQRIDEALDALRTRVDRALKELGARVNEQQRQVAEHAADQLARQAALQAEVVARVEARMGRGLQSAEETLAALRETVAEQQQQLAQLGERVDAAADREPAGGGEGVEALLDELRAQSAHHSQVLEDHETRLAQADAGDERLTQRVEVHAALVESFDGRIDEQTQFATRTGVDLERAREERAQLRRQLEGVTSNIALLKDQFMEQRGALLVFRGDLQRIQNELLHAPDAAPPAARQSGELASKDLPQGDDSAGLVTQLELRAALEQAQSEWQRHGTGENPKVDGTPSAKLSEDPRGETPR